MFSGEVADLDESTLYEVFSAVPNSRPEYKKIDPHNASGGWSIIDALVETQLATSKKQAREFVNAGAVTIVNANGMKIATIDTKLTAFGLLFNYMLLLRRGKKNWHACRFGPLK